MTIPSSLPGSLTAGGRKPSVAALPRLKKLSACFAYLDAIRESGITNMFGASLYVEAAFSLRSDTASAVLGAWMKTFDRGTTPTARASAVLAANSASGSPVEIPERSLSPPTPVMDTGEK